MRMLGETIIDRPSWREEVFRVAVTGSGVESRCIEWRRLSMAAGLTDKGEEGGGFVRSLLSGDVEEK
jgi:hypothetical protein